MPPNDMFLTLSNKDTDLEAESDIFAYSDALASGEKISEIKSTSSKATKQ